MTNTNLRNAINEAINNNNYKTISDLNKSELKEMLIKNPDLHYEIINDLKNCEYDFYISDVLKEFSKTGAFIDYNIGDYGYNYIKSCRDTLENYYNIISALSNISDYYYVSLDKNDIIDLYDVTRKYYYNYTYFEHEIIYDILTKKINKLLNALENEFETVLNYYDNIDNVVDKIQYSDYEIENLFFDNDLKAFKIDICAY